MNGGEDRAPIARADEALYARVEDGDAEAFDELVDRLHGPMLRFARSIVGEQGAREVVQDTWAAVLDGLERFEGRSSLKTWIYRILANRAKTWAARERRTLPVPFFGEGDLGDEPAVDPARFSRRGKWTTPIAPWTARTPEELYLDREAGALVARELENLPAAQRAVVILRDVEGSSSEEVCAILGLSEANQRVLLHRGRSKLRAALEHRLARRQAT